MLHRDRPRRRSAGYSSWRRSMPSYGRSVPFDVQTEFYQVQQAAGAPGGGCARTDRAGPGFLSEATSVTAADPLRLRRSPPPAGGQLRPRLRPARRRGLPPVPRQDRRAGIRPVVLHFSGPLLDWLEGRPEGARYPRPGRTPGQPRAMSSCCWPATTSRSWPSSRGRIAWSRSPGCGRRSAGGSASTAQGLWLTERVWEPDLAADLADAGVRYGPGGRPPLPGERVRARTAA